MTDEAKTTDEQPIAGETARPPADAPPAAPAPPEGEPVVETDTPVEDVPPADPLTEAQEQAAEYLQLAQRKQAEFENFRKRMQTQVSQSEARGVAKVAKELLAPLDHLGLAIEHADDGLKDPLASVQRELFDALGRVGVESFDPTGEPFDPNVHEAMTQQPVEGAESGTVVSVYQRGYRIGETVLRPARVVVAA